MPEGGCANNVGVESAQKSSVNIKTRHRRFIDNPLVLWRKETFIYNEAATFREEYDFMDIGRFSGSRVTLVQRLPVVGLQWHIVELVIAYGGGTALAFHQTSLSVSAMLKTYRKIWEKASQ